MKLKPIFILISLVWLLTGCVNNQTTSKLLFPANNYVAITWYPGENLIVFYKDERGNLLGIQSNQPIPKLYVNLEEMPQNLKCKNGEEYAFHGLLADGRYQLVEMCKPSSSAAYEQDSFLIAYNPFTGQTEKLVTEPLIHKWANHFAWNPDTTLGIYQTGNSIAAANIHWMTKEKTLPMNITIGNEKHSWVLSKDYPQDSSEDGVAAYPSWSPDGEKIAFFASIDAIGKSVSMRSDSAFSLYFMDPHEQNPYPVLDKIFHPLDLLWSPDNQHLAFIGEYGTLRKYGVWIYSINSKTINLLSTGDFNEIVWSPDGRKIAAALCLEDLLCEHKEIWEYDLGISE